MLIKGVLNSNCNTNYYSLNIKNYVDKNKLYGGLIIEDYLGNIHTNLKTPKIIFHLFIKKIVAISSHSFQQNNKILGNKIRKYVSNIINNTINDDFILCIGGESYLYGLTTNNKTIHLTNNENIKHDCEYNFNTLYNSKYLTYNKVIDYNFINRSLEKDIINIINNKIQLCVLNLSKLNIEIIKLLNFSNINKIIIINCHHNDFWKKIKKLTNYKLITRKQFICHNMNYFITVNVFIRKNCIIPLGNNCSVAYQMNKLKVRNTAYPFDWCSSTLQKLINVLDNDFDEFISSISINKKSYNHLPLVYLDDDNTKLNIDNIANIDNINNINYSYVLSNKYNLQFAHEVLKNDVNDFKQKLERRINRFKNCINPIFLRLENKKINLENYKKLINTFNKLFNNYKIIVLTTQIIDFEFTKLKFIKINDQFYDWKYNNINWKDIIMNV